ncbi:MAG: hypothetical protein R3B40_12265 [Polyangiales bacterium]|nr:hypothetical protein [Sandaracinaceae bacterium]
MRRPALALRAVIALASLLTAATAVSLAPDTASAEAGTKIRRAPRPGVRVRFASLDGQSGMQGNAFLLFSSRRISLDSPASPCGGSHVVRAEARGSSGLIRKIELTLHLGRSGQLAVQQGGCPRAELRAELEDGTILTGGEGTVDVQRAELQSGGQVMGTYSWTATRAGAPFPTRGEFSFTLP